MKRRAFLTGIGAAGSAALAGCINQTQTYGFDETVSVREGEVSLINTRVAKTLFTQPSDTPTNLLGDDGAQYVVFVFDTTDLDVEPRRKHDYLQDFLQYRLGSDTVAPIVSTEPRVTVEDENTTSVAFRVLVPFAASGTRLRWTGDTNAVWPAEPLFAEHADFLSDPPEFTVENLSLNKQQTVATVSLTVRNEGGTDGEFNAIVRAEDTVYVTESVPSGTSVDISTDVTIEDNDQAVLISWGTDQRNVSVHPITVGFDLNRR